MFREMRRNKQRLSPEETEALLAGGSHGVLAVSGDGGWPYAVPLSYAYEAGRIYIHCAKAGHKIDAIRRSDKASFCVVARDEVVQSEFTTHYMSAIAFGRVRELEDDAEKREAIALLCRKYCPGMGEGEINAAIGREWAALNILEFTIEHLSGKAARELLQARGTKL